MANGTVNLNKILGSHSHELGFGNMFNFIITQTAKTNSSNGSSSFKQQVSNSNVQQWQYTWHFKQAPQHQNKICTTLHNSTAWSFGFKQTTATTSL
jgi:hypothetical protein